MRLRRVGIRTGMIFAVAVAAVVSSADVSRASQSTTSVTVAFASVLWDVSCSSTRACTAVGNYETTENGSAWATLAERWNGIRWVIEPTPNPKGPGRSVPTGVSCPSARFCTAVGQHENSAGTSGSVLAERWNGTNWAIERTPDPKLAPLSNLRDVSCRSATFCTAVGSNTNISGSPSWTLAEHWNGRSWAIQTTPNPSGADFEGVSCPSLRVCTAVGSYTNSSGRASWTLAEHWNGRSWAIQSTPNPKDAGFSFLYGLSCPSATACTAVGNYDNTSEGLTLTERWNGRSWAIQSTPNPRHAASPRLSGVSCPSTNACTTVGSYNVLPDGFEAQLAERWNGRSWAIQPTVNSGGPVLEGVSCPSTTTCTAVGSRNNSSGIEVTFAERWNGRSWSIKSTPNPQ